MTHYCNTACRESQVRLRPHAPATKPRSRLATIGLGVLGGVCLSLWTTILFVIVPLAFGR